MDAKKAGASLDSLMSAFNSRISELQNLVIARNSQSIWFLFSRFLILFCTYTSIFLQLVEIRGTTLEIWILVRFAVYPASSVSDLSAVDVELTAMELQVQGIKDRLREETLVIPKAKVFDFFLLSFCLNLWFYICLFVLIHFRWIVGFWAVRPEVVE